jgi:GTP-binding protein EngB required for normal cell division
MTETKYVTPFEKIFQTYDKVERYLDLSDNFKSYILDKRSWIDRLKSAEFPVAFLGHFTTGKSTIINAILGKSILPEATKAYTAIPTLLKKGDEDRVIIHYLGETERQELRNLYIEEISKELHKSAQGYLELNNRELLPKLDKDISEVVNASRAAFGKGKSFKELKALIKDWDKLNGETKEIRLSEMHRYVTEDYSDVLFVDKAEVFLTELDIPEGVVLVDLPGLGVVNPRHKKITEDYVKEQAKAFVIVSAVFHLLEGEEALLLERINKERPSVLQRAFWVINKWDTLNEQHKKEESANFESKVREYHFDVTPERVFKVTGLYYLLLKLIETGELENSGNIRTHVDGLKKFLGKIPQAPEEAKGCITQKSETRDFLQLKNSLFDYLQTTAKREFLDEAKSECLDLTNKLCEAVEPLRMDLDIDENAKAIYIRDEVRKQSRETLNNIREKLIEAGINGILKDIDTSPEKISWTQEAQAELTREIEATINSFNMPELKNDLKQGLDRDIIWCDLPSILNKKLTIEKMFRQQFIGLMENNVAKTFSQKLVKNINANPLPENLKEALQDKLSSRDLLARLKGLCDIFLFEYGETLNKCGTEISEPSFREENSFHGEKTDDDVIKSALEHYQQSLITFFSDLKINERTRRSVENYFKEMKGELLELFADKHGKIESEIEELIKPNVISELEKALSSEEQSTINQSYRDLKEIQLGCQG